MQNKVLNVLLLIVFAIGIIGASNLVYSEFTQHHICPKLLEMPACYIIMACFVIPFIAHVFNKNKGVYFLFTGLAFVIALVASIMEFIGLGECPKTPSGTPMCYYSFLLFLSLIVLKLILNTSSIKKSS